MKTTTSLIFASVLAASLFASGCGGGGGDAVRAPGEELQPTGSAPAEGEEPTLSEEGP